jgi:hypothetical protein
MIILLFVLSLLSCYQCYIHTNTIRYILLSRSLSLSSPSSLSLLNRSNNIIRQYYRLYSTINSDDIIIKKDENNDINNIENNNNNNNIDEIEDLDIQFVTETVLDQSIEKAVKQLISDGLNIPQIDPVEKFNTMYKDIKSRKNGTATASSFDSTKMLQELFPDSQQNDPFDEKKVMLKLRTMLGGEDFQQLFEDPSIGDWL